MIITDQELEEFRTLYKNRFNEDIDENAARQEFLRLLELVRTLWIPLPKGAIKQSEERILEYWKKSLTGAKL